RQRDGHGRRLSGDRARGTDRHDRAVRRGLDRRRDAGTGRPHRGGRQDHAHDDNPLCVESSAGRCACHRHDRRHDRRLQPAGGSAGVDGGWRSPVTWRGAGAVFAGFVAVFVLSLGTDEVLHVLAIYPPWGEPMRDPMLNLLALSYRLVYDTFGSYLTARL